MYDLMVVAALFTVLPAPSSAARQTPHPDTFPGLDFPLQEQPGERASRFAVDAQAGAERPVRAIIPAPTRTEPALEVGGPVVRAPGLPPPALPPTVEPRSSCLRSSAPAPVGSAARNAGERAREVIARAIARKRGARAEAGDYVYDAYVKFAVRNLRTPPDSAASVLLVRETRSSVHAQGSGPYQERILARRRSSGLDPEEHFLAVGEIVSPDRERVHLRQFSLVSPVADDALDHYEYVILDTLIVDDRAAYRLGVRPRTEAAPLFVGVVDVDVATYQVTAIDVSVNAAARFTYADRIRYQERYAPTAVGLWLPNEIRLTGEVHLALPVPGMPRSAAFEHVAWIGRFRRSDPAGRPRDLRQVRVVVDDAADDRAITIWDQPAAVPLTEAERAAWARIDSIGRSTDVRRRVGRTLGAVASRAGDPDFLRFNRVDGPYVGAAREWTAISGTVLTTKLGYAFGSELWQYRAGGRVRISGGPDVWAGASYHDETVRRHALISGTYDPSLLALIERLDPLDYYRERGFSVFGSARVVGFARLGLQYHDVEHSSLAVPRSYPRIGSDRAVRPNPRIVDGHLRSLEAQLSVDSRPVTRTRRGDHPVPQLPLTRVSVVAEIADPELVPSDFFFRHYSVHFQRRQRSWSRGVSTLRAAAGATTGIAPPQRYFTVDFGPDVAYQGLAFQGSGFNTLGETNFSGNRVAMVIMHHDFDRLLFLASRHPQVRRIPFTLSANAGAFWTDFVDHSPNPGDSLLNTARRPYVEVGFGIGNLTPFFSPFNFEANFTWQLSSYPTQRFQFGLGVTP